MRPEIYAHVKRHRGFWSRVAFLLPQKLVYWCAVRVLIRASCCGWAREDVTKITALTAMDRWRAVEMDGWWWNLGKEHKHAPD